MTLKGGKSDKIIESTEKKVFQVDITAIWTADKIVSNATIWTMSAKGEG